MKSFNHLIRLIVFRVRIREMRKVLIFLSLSFIFYSFISLSPTFCCFFICVNDDDTDDSDDDDDDDDDDDNDQLKEGYYHHHHHLTRSLVHG